MTATVAASTSPADQVCAAHVRPSGWVNPSAAPRYDLVVVGGGTAGLVSAMGAAGLGARVALVERDALGGDCLNHGCVPSKALIRSARAIGELAKAAALGVSAPHRQVDFTRVMERMRERRASIAVNDGAARLQRAGVDVFFGDAQFVDPRTVVVDRQRLRFRRAVIATGSRPASPPLPGLDAVPFMTNHSVFNLTDLPPRLLIVGAGPIGCELAQAFARFGSSVTLLDHAPHVLPRESAAAAAIVERRLLQDGVQLVLGARLLRVATELGGIAMHYMQDGLASSAPVCVVGARLLVAAGRRPNVENLGLDAAGVVCNDEGVVVSDHLQTSNRRIYASGDVCSRFKFTHAADAMSRLVLQNALFYGRRRASSLVIPWVTYTDPEVAHVGVSHTEAAASHGRLATITIPLAGIDRAVVDDETDGFIEVHHERGRLRGCTIVAPHAGEMIGEAAYALTYGGTLAQLSATVHPYPTIAEGLRKAGDAYRRQALTPGRREWLARYFRWTR